MKGELQALLAAAALLAQPRALAADPAGVNPAAASARGDPAIIVTINPEDRVGVALSGGPPGPAACGTTVELGIRVVNQGFSTGPLVAELVDAPRGAVLDFPAGRLSGSPQESRTLRITLPNTKAADLTIAFRLRNEAPDLGGRDRVHLLVRPP